MSGNKTGISPIDQRYDHSLADEFLWWLSTAETRIIKDCAVDRNRYRIVGMSVLATWLFATLAWTYFFSTTVEHAYAYIPLGLFMGFIILTIDRMLIKGINRNNKRRLMPFAFRALLAITIGTFMAQPAVLYLFDKEIKLQTSLDNEQRKLVKQQELDTFYMAQKVNLQAERLALQSAIDQKYEEVMTARKAFIAETDGSGGTGKIGISTIALAKKKEYEKVEQDWRELKSVLEPNIDSLNRQLAGIDSAKKSQQSQYDALLNNGFLTRITALQNLVKSNDALAYRYYLIIVILVLIELMPVIAKSLLPSGPYEEKVRLQENMEVEQMARTIEREQQLKEYFNDAAMEADKAAIDKFFRVGQQARFDRINGYAEEYASGRHPHFDGLWNRMKREIMTRWEN